RRGAGGERDGHARGRSRALPDGRHLPAQPAHLPPGEEPRAAPVCGFAEHPRRRVHRARAAAGRGDATEPRAGAAKLDGQQDRARCAPTPVRRPAFLARVRPRGADRRCARRVPAEGARSGRAARAARARRRRMRAIASRDNARYKALAKLISSAKERRASGLSVLEGTHLLAAYLDAGGKPEAVAASVAALDEPEVTALITRASPAVVT